MRVYISVDMEGVAGVVHEDQTNPTDPRHAGEYNRFRRLMTSEANAAVEGALAAGAARYWSTTVTGSCATCWPRTFIRRRSC